MNRAMETLHRVFAASVAIATLVAVIDLSTGSAASLGQQADAIFASLAVGALLEMIGVLLLEGYKALQRRS